MGTTKKKAGGLKIGVLIGRGSNCTCSDCPVLYGGKCYTTPINNKKQKRYGKKEV